MSDDTHDRSDARCVGCGAPPPPTDPDHTLISSHGWRLTRGADKRGKKVMEWRCPDCWTAFRKRPKP
jgi:hypothetical protein